MSEFSSKLVLHQFNSIYHPTLQQIFEKSSPMSNDSGIELWDLSKTISPVDSVLSNGSEYQWDGHVNYVQEKANETHADSEFKYYKPKRASSLKTNRTPPGTPKSKAVRFADAFGLDLEDIRHVFNLDVPPKIPASAVQDLVLDNDNDSVLNDQALYYKPNFDQPGAASDFLRRVRMHNVSLENAFIDKNFLSGTVRVMNLSFEKKVIIRLTFNDWKSQVDLLATYIPDSYNGVTDLFSFSILLPMECQNPGQKIQFAVSYETVNSIVYWDNNFGQNYVFNCCSDIQIFNDR